MPIQCTIEVAWTEAVGDFCQRLQASPIISNELKWDKYITLPDVEYEKTLIVPLTKKNRYSEHSP